LDRLPGGDAQDDASPLDLIPGERPTTGDLQQDRGIVRADPQGKRFSTTHGATPVAGVQGKFQRTGSPEIVALLRAGDTSASSTLNLRV